MQCRKVRLALDRGLKALEREEAKGAVDPVYKQQLIQLDSLLTQRRFKEARAAAQAVLEHVQHINKRPWPKRLAEFLFTIGAVVLAAGAIRQTCFELYEIPTGSMRPTFKEKDRVLVSKTAFGINIPLRTQHLFFSPANVERGSIVVFTTDGLDLPDTDAMYFGIFPGKKRYVKRCAALPGDWLYFYGGDLFCLAKDGKTIHKLKACASIPEREYLPFLSSFEGRVETSAPMPFGRPQTYLLKHFNQPLGRIDLSPGDASLDSQIPWNGRWVAECSPAIPPKEAPKTMGEFWGIQHTATCRLLLPEQLPKQARLLGYEDPHAVLWLEVHHSPALPPSGKTRSGAIPLVVPAVTWVPLNNGHCEKVARALYSARLLVRNNRLFRYHYEGHDGPGVMLPKAIPDGCYEWYFGKAFKVGFGGTAHELPASHPLYPKTAREIAFWFNAGIDVTPSAISSSAAHTPTRFAYFRDGALVLMNTPIVSKDEPTLAAFGMMENKRRAKDPSYPVFLDAGAPLSPEFLKKFGYKVPERHYIVLGDNPAMSVDSRVFGPVPEENIQGTPVFLFWPFGPRWGAPLQPSRGPSLYTLVILSLTAAGTAMYARGQRQKRAALLSRLRDSTR